MKKMAILFALVMVFVIGGYNLQFAQAMPLNLDIVVSTTGVDLPADFRPGAEFDFLGNHDWGSAGNQWGTIVGGPSMPTISWQQKGFAGYNVLAAVAVFDTGGWGDLSGLPELYLNGEAIGSFGDSAPGNQYSRDFFWLDPELVTQTSLSFSFTDPQTGGSGWNKWFELGRMYKMEVVALVDSTNAPVPEPATMLLFGTGLVGLVGWRKRNR